MGTETTTTERRVTCRACKGQGERATDLRDQPEHTKRPNLSWEPWEPDFDTCPYCAGRGTVAHADRF